MQVVLLAKGSWRLDPAAPLGKPGGFGAVFSGLAPDGSAVAVKRFKVTGDNAEHREMQMADFLIGQDLLGVMPVLDSGLDKRSDRYFLVMPLAEGSLQDFVDLHGAIPESDAIDILLAIATGLASLDSLVHRDLKPHNVLKHDSIWKVADFGLARFVEDATSAQTVKNCMTVPYAAPEQLRMDRCTKATDVYALGCIAHTLLTGKPPFKGPRHADYFRQHTQEQPEEVPASPPLRGLTTSMLLKSPGARPSIGRVLAQLERARRDRAGPVDPLAEAAAKIANAGAVVEAASERASAVLKTRNDLARTGLEQLDSLIKNLYDEVCTAAPLAHRERNVVSLGDGHIQLFLEYGIVDEEAFARAIWSDVVAGRCCLLANLVHVVTADRQTYGTLISMVAEATGGGRRPTGVGGEPTIWMLLPRFEGLKDFALPPRWSLA